MTNTGIAKQKATKKELKLVGPEHLDAISKIHMAAFPKSSWSRLGKAVVEKYYLWQLNEIHPLVSAKSCYIEGACVGFCFSGIFKGSTSGFLRTYRNLLLKKAIVKPWLVIHPEFRKGLITTNKILRPFRKTKIIEPAKELKQNENPSYGVLSIAVRPDYQGYGIGKELLDDAEQNARKNNFRRMHLTVNVDNFQAIRFYERSGWERVLVSDSWGGTMEKRLI